MVYCRIETNLWPSRLEGGECATNKGSAAAPRGCVAPPPHLRRTYKVLAFVTPVNERYQTRLSRRDCLGSRFHDDHQGKTEYLGVVFQPRLTTKQRLNHHRGS
jgi:hypothetical protein